MRVLISILTFLASVSPVYADWQVFRNSGNRSGAYAILSITLYDQPGSHRAIDVDFSPNLGCSAGLGYMEFTGSAWGSPMASQATPAGELKFEIGGKRWVGQPYIINYSNGLEAFFAPANVELVNSILAGEIIHAQLNNRLAPIEWPPAANGAIASQQAKNICIQDLVQ